MQLLSQFLIAVFSLAVQHSIRPHEIIKDNDQLSSLQIVHVLRGETNPTLVKDNIGNQFLVKQDNSALGENRCMNEWFAPVAELFGATIAQSINIQTNKIKLIQPHIICISKTSRNRSATLHTYIPTITLKHPGTDFKKLSLDKSLAQNLEFIARHEGLGTIFAADTFVNNADRHFANILYNFWTGSLYAIDYGRSLYKSNVAKSMNEHCKKHATDIFTRQQLAVLNRYKMALTTLIQKWPIEKTQILFENLVIQAKIFSTTFISKKKKLTKAFNNRLNLIKNSFQSTQDLIATLDSILKYNNHHDLFPELDLVYWLPHSKNKFVNSWARIPQQGVLTLSALAF